MEYNLGASINVGWAQRIKLLLLATIASLGLIFATVIPAFAAPPPSGAAYIWENVEIDGEQYLIRGGHTTQRNGKTTSSTTFCWYFDQPAPGTPWTQWQSRGKYTVNYLIPNTSEAALKQHCIDNFDNRTGDPL